MEGGICFTFSPVRLTAVLLVQSGSYMFIETSYPRLNRDAARLISPQISTTDGNCLSFFFHMKGLNIRELAVYFQSKSGSRTVVWRVQGDQGDAWQPAVVPLKFPEHSFIKVMEMYHGDSLPTMTHNFSLSV